MDKQDQQDNVFTPIYTNGDGNCFFYLLAAIGVLAKSLVGEDRFTRIFGPYFTNASFDLIGFRKLLQTLLLVRRRKLDCKVIPENKQGFFNVLLNVDDADEEFEKMEKSGHSIDSNFAEVILYILANLLQLRFELHTSYGTSLIESPGHGTQTDQAKIPLVKIYFTNGHFTGAMDLTNTPVSAATLNLLQRPFDAAGKVTGKYAGADGGPLYLKYLNDLLLSQEKDMIAHATRQTKEIFAKTLADAQRKADTLANTITAPPGYKVKVTVTFELE